MKRKIVAPLVVATLLALSACGGKDESSAAKSAPTPTAAKAVCTAAWSPYIGWAPIPLMASNGTLAKYAAKHGVEVKVLPMMTYADSLTQFAGGAFHAVASTNMDALMALSAVETEAIVVGDYSNGNDGVVLRDGKKPSDIKGRSVQLVQGTVSHYLLSRMLTEYKVPSTSVKLVDVSDENNIVGAFTGNADKNAAVITWYPFLADVRNAKGSTMVFDSSQIPGEIVDMIVVRKDTPEGCKKAIVGAWYETIAVLTKGGAERADAVKFLATSMNQTVAEAEAQLKTTAMFYTPKDARVFTEAADLKRVMGLIRALAKEETARGAMNAKDVENVGIKFPDGSVVGNPANVRLYFNSTYMRMAEEGKL